MTKELTNTTLKEKQKAPLKAQIQEMISVLSAFTNLLLKETEALKKSDFKTVDTLQADKKMFAKQYDAKVSALAARRDEFIHLELPVREQLMKERARFSNVLNDNMKALELAQHSTKRLVNRILEAARHAITDDQQTNYSNAGKALSYKSATMSLSIDQSL